MTKTNRIFLTLVFAIGLISPLVMIVFKLSPAVLDILVAINLGLGLFIFILALLLNNIISFKIFAPFFAAVVLYRMALNVSVTRSILIYGKAGEIIESLGQFLAGGNFIVGLILFVFLTIPYPIVIIFVYKLISKNIHQHRPEGENNTKDFNGDQKKIMYGILKLITVLFAIEACLGIVLFIVDIFAGVILGTAQVGLTLGEAMRTYSILAIGDGLAFVLPGYVMIPALGLIGLTKLKDLK